MNVHKTTLCPMPSFGLLALAWLLCQTASALGQDAVTATTEGPEPSAQSTESNEVAENVSVNDVTSDEAIASRLTDILKATGWFADLEVQVDQSVVFLAGTAQEQEQREWAARLARNTEGVAAVVDRIQVNKDVDVSAAVAAVTSSVRTMWEDFLIWSPLLVAGILVLLTTSLLSRIAKLVVTRFATRSRLRVGLQDLMLQLTTIAVWITGLMVAAIVVFPGMTPAKVLTVLGLSSVAVGFAFKDIFENFFAGVLILWKYPFDKGDFIECGDITGRIEEITIRMTMIRQVDGQLVVVPNAMLFKNPVDVLTNRPARRTTVICGVAYDTDLAQAGDVIRTAVSECSTVRDEQPIEIFSQEFADSSINFEVTWWTGATPLDVRQSRDEVVKAVKRALDEADIEIPFPQRTLWWPESLHLKNEQNGIASSDGKAISASNLAAETGE